MTHLRQVTATGTTLLQNTWQKGLPCDNCEGIDTKYNKAVNAPGGGAPEDVWGCTTKEVFGDCKKCKVCKTDESLMARLPTPVQCR